MGSSISGPEFDAEQTFNFASFVTNSEHIFELCAPSAAQIYAVADFVTAGAEVETICISGLNLETGQGFVPITQLCKAISECQSPAKLMLNMANQEITAEMAKTIPLQHPAIVELNLNGTYIGDEGGKTIGNAMLHNIGITTLKLGSNLTLESAKAVGDALRKNRTLTTLEFGGFPIREEGAKAFVEGLRENHVMVSVGFCIFVMFCGKQHSNVVHTEFGAEGTKLIANALLNHHALTELDLRSNLVADEGAKAIAATLLRPDQSLSKLDLHDNQIRSTGAKAISKALAENHTLTTLCLSGNEFEQEGATAIGEALLKNRTLTTLDLAWNKIADAGAKAIAAALAKNYILTSLMLDSNIIGCEGAKPILAALLKRPSSIELSLADNKIRNEGAREVADWIVKNRVLNKLNICRNELDSEGKKIIAQALKQNGGVSVVNYFVRRSGFGLFSSSFSSM